MTFGQFLRACRAAGPYAGARLLGKLRGKAIERFGVVVRSTKPGHLRSRVRYEGRQYSHIEYEETDQQVLEQCKPGTKVVLAVWIWKERGKFKDEWRFWRLHQPDKK